MTLRIFLFIAITFTTGSTFSEEADLCDNNRVLSESAAAFPKSYAAAVVLSKVLCENHIHSVQEFSKETILSANEWKKAALEETTPLKMVGIDLSKEIDQIYKETLDGAPFIYFQVSKVGANISYRLTGDIPVPIDDNNACKALSAGLSCDRLLKQFTAVTEAINDPSNLITLEGAYIKLGLYGDAWTRYFTKARSQTFIELGINTWRYSDELQKGESVLPPSSQFIFLHPSVAIEYVDNAIDGQQQKEALVMEWVGMNWWDWPVPFGFSVISSYTDRTGLDDHALGLMFHLYNNYSIAYTHRSGGDGVMVTVDLLKLFEDKKTNLDDYKNKAENYIVKAKNAL